MDQPELDPRPSIDPPDPPITHDLSGVLDALLRRPAALLEADASGARKWIALIAIGGVASTGALMASWSGGLQLAIVPMKLVALTAVAAIVCLPSLHVLSALSGARQSASETASALSMGMALAAVIAVALAPIAWVLSAATDSLPLVGTLYLCVFLVATGLGLRLVRRAMASSTGAAVRGLGAWSFLFVLVALQLATTLRPLVGPFDGALVHERTFFLEHLALSLR
jgi:hypothetical protein